MNVYKRLKQLLNKKQKRTVLLLIILIFFSALLETLSVSVIIPLMTAVIDPDEIFNHQIVADVLNTLNLTISDKDHFIRILIGVTMGVFVIKNLYLLFLYFVQSSFVTKTEAATSVRLYNDYLGRPYEFYLNADVNAMFQTINKDIPHVFELLQESMKLITEIAVSACICIMLFIIDFKMTLSIALIMVVMLGFIVLVLKPKLGGLGQKRVKQQVLTMKWMQQGVFGIKDAKVAHKEDHFLDNFTDAYNKLAGVTRKYTVFNNAPRLVIETVCIVGLLGYMLVCILSGQDMLEMIPTLTAFGLAAVRLMPGVNRISSHLSTIAYYEPSLNFICDNLDFTNMSAIDSAKNHERLVLKDKITLNDITFAYPNSEKNIFDKASMEIKKGTSVGVMGPSGAGKTTVIDILLGLLKPASGTVCVDDTNIEDDYAGFLSNVGYIAQNIYMLDASIRDNVAFGVNEKDQDETRIWKVLEQAQMADFIKSLPEGLDTIIGDRGVRLSGGQRQRLGIARALYHDPEILVFDEATSALDTDTESAIMDAINILRGEKTMVIIAHRLNTIANCDQIYKVENGKITETTLDNIE